MKTCPLLFCGMEICRKCRNHVIPPRLLPKNANDDLGISAAGEQLFVIGEMHSKRIEFCLCLSKKRRKNG